MQVENWKIVQVSEGYWIEGNAYGTDLFEEGQYIHTDLLQLIEFPKDEDPVVNKSFTLGKALEDKE
jgi:hypothetical protein